MEGRASSWPELACRREPACERSQLAPWEECERERERGKVDVGSSHHIIPPLGASRPGGSMASSWVVRAHGEQVVRSRFTSGVLVHPAPEAVVAWRRRGGRRQSARRELEQRATARAGGAVGADAIRRRVHLGGGSKARDGDAERLASSELLAARRGGPRSGGLLDDGRRQPRRWAGVVRGAGGGGALLRSGGLLDDERVYGLLRRSSSRGCSLLRRSSSCGSEVLLGGGRRAECGRGCSLLRRSASCGSLLRRRASCGARRAGARRGGAVVAAVGGGVQAARVEGEEGARVCLELREDVSRRLRQQRRLCGAIGRAPVGC